MGILVVSRKQQRRPSAVTIRARAGIIVTGAGVAMQLIGLVWDAALHRMDADLGAREGIFTLSNPGHALLAGGLGLVVLGIGLSILAVDSRWCRWRRGGVLAAIAAVSVGAVAVASTVETDHAHTVEQVHVHEDGTTHTHAQHQIFQEEQSRATVPGHEHGTGPLGAFGDEGLNHHQHRPDIPITAGDLARLSQQLEAARAATEQYQDVRAALRDGYIEISQDLPGIAAHFIKPAYLASDTFDPAKPAILLYARLDGRWTLVGLSYVRPFDGSEQPPEGFAGPLDVWHYHTNLCFQGPRLLSATLSAIECGAAGGRFIENSGWMTHLWLYMESPEGLFAHQNSLLKGTDAVLTEDELAAQP